MSSEPLKRVSVGPIFRNRLGFSGAKEGGACLDAGAADEAGVAGNHVFDVARRPVTELTTSFGDEMLCHCFALNQQQPPSPRDRALEQTAEKRKEDTNAV